ncbi:MAG TPA: hypothetical protein ENF50_01075 [Archaeoglobus veneficus]|nr:hypothetical protein [Archaeoglobus veneficus]
MLNATANTRLLKKVIKASNALLSETRVRISKEGIAVRAVDAGNVCLTDVFIPEFHLKSPAFSSSALRASSNFCGFLQYTYTHLPKPP